MRMGLGHKYWSKFDVEQQTEIEELSKELNEMMFLPKLETPIKTLDVPMCGKHNNSALPLIYEFVKICNNSTESEEDDENGEKTIEFLKQTRKIARLINSNHPSSLGLHPLIYFYAKNGSFRVSAFYAFVTFIIDLDKNNKKNLFIKHRASFEEIYYKNSALVQLITRKYRSSTNAMVQVKKFFMEILYLLEQGIGKEYVIEKIIEKKEYSYLPNNIAEDDMVETAEFNSKRKSEVFIRDALKSAIKCPICGGYINKNAISIDHISRKQDGGKSNVENGQVTHPYCNTGYKN